MEVIIMYEFKLNEKEMEMVLYALSKMDRDLNSNYEEYKELFMDLQKSIITQDLFRSKQEN